MLKLGNIILWKPEEMMMKSIASETLNHLWYDLDQRETMLRAIISERLAEKPPPASDDYIIASYFFAFRTQTLNHAVSEISYHATSGVKNPPAGSLLEQCSAVPAGVDAFDATGRIGLLHVAFPLKMMLHPDGHLTSCDILHTTAGAIIFDVFENQDARLVRLHLPDSVVRTFPGPEFGPLGLREKAGFSPNQPAFGTILKPTAGITPNDVGQLVAGVAACPLFMFVKEDEDLYPDLSYSPVRDRVKQAVQAIEAARHQRNGLGLFFAPHITGSPAEVMAHLEVVLEAGANAVMFSESYNGGTLRMVREATRKMSNPPAIYLHNAGIGVKTRAIWREVIDYLARLEGMDFRQTAPVKPGTPFLRPYGQEWEADEEVLSRPIPGIRATMIARAGGLDQGNIGLNLADARKRGLESNILFLAGSAINSIKNERGIPDAAIGAEAMIQAIELHYSGKLDGVAPHEYLHVLVDLAKAGKLNSLLSALHQRYGEKVKTV
jgi:ribulose-bisphosphate carboxylase large chain